MVKQEQSAKTSSRDWGSDYRFPSYVESSSILPETTEAKLVEDLGSIGGVDGVSGYVISGNLGDAAAEWPEPPHVAFANLLAEKPEAVETFVKRYGLLSRLYIDGNDPDGNRFTIDSATFLEKQDRLRSGWRYASATKEEDCPAGGAVAFADIEGEVEEGFDTDVVVAYRYVQLRPKDLWAAICLLFLWDWKTQKLGFCESPDCPAPFFRKKRKTQKFCEQGPCVAYAQRQYSLDWWNRVGKKRRDKKAKAQKRSKA
jgi:hypothetical protein